MSFSLGGIRDDDDDDDDDEEEGEEEEIGITKTACFEFYGIP